MSGASDTFFTTFDKNFIQLELLPFAFSNIRLAGKIYLNLIVILQTNNVFSAWTNESSMVLARDFDYLKSFIGLYIYNYHEPRLSQQ